MAAPGAESAPPVPWLFVVIAIVVAVVVSALIAYLGVTGHLGAGIPGSKSPGGSLVLGAALVGALPRRGLRRREP